MDAQFIPFLLGAVVGLSTQLLPSWFYLRNAPRWDGRKLEMRHKNKSYVRWAVPLTTILLFVIFFAAFFGKSPTGSPAHTFFFVVLFTSLHSLIVGAFEIVSGVSVKFRRHLSNEYIVSGAVREAGRARVVYSLMVMALSYWVRQVW